MSRRSSIGWVAALGLALLSLGCEDEEKGAACRADQDCQRGQICGDGACTIVACDRIGDCPGTGRTCLSDLRSCSLKECADTRDGVELQCAAGQECISSGPFRSSCVAPGAGMGCSEDRDCAAQGVGLSCCRGVCAASCAPPDDSVLPTGDQRVPTDMQPADQGPVDVDQGQPPAGGRLCSPCTNDGECGALGAGARCTAIGGAGSFCTSACGGGAGDCPLGYQCVQGFEQCLPASFECTGCLIQDCPAGQVCDVFTGDCRAPQGVCGTCTDATGCQAGLSCVDFAGARFCFQPSAGGCAAGYEAAGDACVPVSGRCDPCGGTCAGAIPYCDASSGQCRQCGPGTPCAAPLTCDLASLSCTDSGPGCVSDIDCAQPGRGICFNGACIQCFDDTQCPPRNACDAAFNCVPAPCAGVTCQRGAQCNAAAGGLCEPGCRAAADCVLPDEMDCNVQTGQCYFRNGSCSLGSGEGVCAPGGQCLPGLATLGNPERGNCSCLKADPADALSPELIACQPGGFCLQGGLPGLPPPELGTCFGF